MKDIEHLLYKASHEVSMSEKEQESVRSFLKTTMMVSPLVSRVIPSPYFSYTFLFIRKHTFSVAIVALIFFSGTMSAFADKSLPGDPLFGVKTGVNEKVLGWFATTPFDKAQLAVTLAERRIAEAEKIETDSNISKTTKESHQALLDKQVKIADDDTKSLEGANETSDSPQTIAIEAVSSVQLSKTSLNLEDKQSRIKNLREKINSLHDGINSSSLNTSERNKGLRTKAKLISAQKLLLNANGRNSSTTEDEINSAEDIIYSIEGSRKGNNNSEIRPASQTDNHKENDKSKINTQPNTSSQIDKNTVVPRVKIPTDNGEIEED
jgi:hypothetical protein